MPVLVAVVSCYHQICYKWMSTIVQMDKSTIQITNSTTTKINEIIFCFEEAMLEIRSFPIPCEVEKKEKEKKKLMAWNRIESNGMNY